MPLLETYVSICVGCVCLAGCTEILNVFIASNAQGTALALPALGAGAVAFEDHDAVGGGGGDEGGAVAVAGPCRAGVEGDVAQAVAEGAEQEGDVAAEPGELQSAES